jgi:hypothetical protein
VGKDFESSAAPSPAPSASSSCDPPLSSAAGFAAGTPNPLKLDPPNKEVVGGVVEASPSGVFGGGLPKPNPTGLPKLPLFADPKPANADDGLPNGLVIGGLSGTLNGFAEVVPKRFVVALEVVSVLASFSLSLLLSDNFDELLPKLPKGDAVDEPNGLDPNGDVGLAPESVEVLGAERKSGTFAVDPNADFGGLEGAAEVVLEVGSVNADDAVTSTFGEKPPPLVGAVLCGVDTLPNPVKPEDKVGVGFEAGALLEDDEGPSIDLF